MKTSTIIRFALAAVCATLACVGLLVNVPALPAIFAGASCLLVMGRSEVTRPIPRSEWWLTFVVVGVLLAVLLTVPFLHLPPAPSIRVRLVLAVVFWPLWMWGIYHRWQREKGKADA